MTKLFNLKIDSRSLALLKIGLVKLDKDSSQMTTVGQFRKVFTSVMKQPDDHELAAILLSYAQETADKQPDETKLNFERLNNLVEAY